MHISILLDIKKTSSRATQMLRLQKAKAAPPTATISLSIILYVSLHHEPSRKPLKNPLKTPLKPPENPLKTQAGFVSAFAPI